MSNIIFLGNLFDGADEEGLRNTIIFYGVVIGVIVAGGLACGFYSDHKTAQIKEIITENIAKNNDIDNFELKLINCDSKYTIDIVGTKVKNQNKEFGAYTYTIPHYSEEDFNTYDKLINIEDYDYSKMVYSTLETLNNLVINETATWTPYTNQEEKQVKKLCAKVNNEMQEKSAEEDFELKM